MVPFIHLFKTPGNYYFYDVNSDAIIRTDHDTYTYLQSYKDDGNFPNQNVENTVIKMITSGLLSSAKIIEIKHPETDSLEYYLENKIKMITLQITQNCNLRCNYCPYSGGYLNREHSSKFMNFETAKRGIDFLISHSSETSEVNIGFYGGEPLLKYDLIKKCVEYAKEVSEGKKVSFSITTNGTLFTDEIIGFFVENGIRITFSLDGPDSIHNKNRKMVDGDTGSFELMMKNVKKIKERYPEYYTSNVTFNTVIDPQNDFACVNNFIAESSLFTDSFFSSSLITDNYARNKLSYTNEFFASRNYELFKVLLYILKRLEKKYVSKLVLAQYEDIKRTRMGKQNRILGRLPKVGHHSGPCLPGVHRLFLNAEGIFYPCERVSESSEIMKIGNLEDGIDLNKAKMLLNVGSISQEECKNCWAFYYCYLCAGSADNLKELSYDVLEPHCVQVRYSVENSMKDYCVLREFGCDFQDENEFSNNN